MGFDQKFARASNAFNRSGASAHAAEFGFIVQLDPADGSAQQLQSMITAKGLDEEVKVVERQGLIPGTLTTQVNTFAMFKDKDLAEQILENFWASKKDVGLMVPELSEGKDFLGKPEKKWQLKSATP